MSTCQTKFRNAPNLLDYGIHGDLKTYELFKMYVANSLFTL